MHFTYKDTEAETSSVTCLNLKCGQWYKDIILGSVTSITACATHRFLGNKWELRMERLE